MDPVLAAYNRLFRGSLCAGHAVPPHISFNSTRLIHGNAPVKRKSKKIRPHVKTASYKNFLIFWTLRFLGLYTDFRLVRRISRQEPTLNTNGHPITHPLLTM